LRFGSKSKPLPAFMRDNASPPTRRTINESTLLFLLAAVQFTHIMDFMIMMPLGPQFMRAFGISPSLFSWLVGAYSCSAGLMGFIAGLFMDRFDRKRALLFLYGGFGLGTLCCALAPNYALLFLARTVAGGFGGVAGSVVLAIVGDVIPLERRGEAMGVIMTAFSLASIFGVPAGLLIANHLGWHAPFFLLAALSAVIWSVGSALLPSLPARHAVNAEKIWPRMKIILTHPNHWRAFALVAVLTIAGSLIYPFLSPSMVSNAGLPEGQLSLIYLFGGAATFLSSRYFGKLSDRHGKPRVFIWLALISAFPTLAVVWMRPSPVWVILVVTTLFMIFSSGRFVPSWAMVTSSVENQYRGGFMSVSSSVQQVAAFLGTVTAGALITADENGRLVGYPRAGILSVVFLVAAVLLARHLRVAASGGIPPPPTEADTALETAR
jgi:predicted MFS family arabinose efflux permease